MKIREISSLIAVAVLAGMTACSQNKKENADTIDTTAMAEEEPEIVDPRVWESPDYDLFDLVGPVKEVVISNKQTSGDGGGGSTVTTIRFDEKGRMIEKIKKGGYPDLHWTITYENDSVMKISNKEYPDHKMKIKRDSKGRIVSIIDSGKIPGGYSRDQTYSYKWDRNRVTCIEDNYYYSANTSLLSYTDGDLYKSKDEGAGEGYSWNYTTEYKINDKDQYGNWINRTLEIQGQDEDDRNGEIEYTRRTETEKRHIEYYEFEPMDQKYAEQPELLKEKLESIKNKTSNQ